MTSPQVLFVCIHNSGRSQMAEAIFNHEAQASGSPWRAISAGMYSGGVLNPLAMDALGEIGVSVAGLKPKQIAPEMLEAASHVVGMGCGVDGSSCPVPFSIDEDWGLDDANEQPMEKIREIRDAIRQKVRVFLERNAPKSG